MSASQYHAGADLPTTVHPHIEHYFYIMSLHRIFLWLLLCASACAAHAAPGSKILATSGASMVEGSAGGGIVPWALIAGYPEYGEFGGSAWATSVRPDDFTLRAFGATASFYNRVELSVAQQAFDINSVIPGETLDQNIFGVKVKLAGDVIYTRMPQISLGLQHKRNSNFDIPSLVGAKDDSGTDVFIAASKLWLDGPFHRSFFLNTSLRATKANQLGLLGFGGDRRDRYRPMLEASTGIFINRHVVIGAEYRQKPSNLRFAEESDWYDVFVGWFPNKRVSVVAAWSDLGSIAGLDEQRGVYISLQLSQ